MKNVENGHHLRPPTMLLSSSIEAPGLELRVGTRLGLKEDRVSSADERRREDPSLTLGRFAGACR